jgi:radical SAM-linked protein
MTFARSVDAAGETLGGRDYFAVWEAALAASGLPIAETDAGRVRFAIGAPLPAGTAGRAELADLWLTERVAAWSVREALDPVLPAGHELVGLDDIWLGAPALAGRVAAADYLVVLGGHPDVGAIAAAADRLLAADRLPRERAKGGGVKTYDLRPLLISIAVGAHQGATDAAELLAVRVRARIHPELGSGRPEEVIAALADEVGASLVPVETIRERLVLADDLGS